MTGQPPGRALLISENAPVPEDRRVWNEARTLVAEGWEVAIACAQAAGGAQQVEETLDGVEIYRYPLRPARSALGYGREYAQALWQIRKLVRRLQAHRPFDVIQVATPPDFLLFAARSARRRGTAFIFDHHDLTPELFRSRYGRRGTIHRLLLSIERRALRSADVVISTNESYRQIAIERGGVPPARVFVVRNGPDLDRFTPATPDRSLRRNRRFLLAYLGMMGPQDGIDHALRALAEVRRIRGDDWRAVFIGDGEVRGTMEDLTRELGLGDQVEFAGWRGDDDIRSILSTADVCLAPDPPSPLNDVSTMIKVPEYMAMGRPIASYDLLETRVSAGAAAAYAAEPRPESLGLCTHELLENESRRLEMGRLGRERVTELSWQGSAEALLAAYACATIGRGVSAPSSKPSCPEPARVSG